MPVTNAGGSGVAAGTVAHFAAATAPSGWIKANGAAISRAIYAKLFTAIGTTYGGGDGSTTFNVPDLRGEFIRGFDDGRGADISRNFGSGQNFATQAQSGRVDFSPMNGDYGAMRNTNSSGVFTTSGTLGNRPQGTGGTGSRRYLDINIGTLGATETRPRNIALLPCIKY
jgi:microcystin-dependent protein